MRFPEFDLGGGDAAARLTALRGRPLNFDPETLGGAGWEHDDYRQPLPPEAPGEPEAGGSWEAAVALSRAYAFADPSLVEARFDTDAPLEGRDLLLLLHVLGVRLYAGVRVGGAGEDTRVVDGREGRVSWWNYRTLEGHVESGQRDFEVWKWSDSGEVEFRTHAVSRPAETSPVVRLGFLLLGRHKQVEFGRRACLRMALLTEAALRRHEARAPARTFDSRLLSIHLRDHHALLVALRELAGRMTSGGRLPEVRTLGAEVRDVAADDVEAVAALLERLGSAPSRARASAAWTGERLGRLKLNGRIVRASPLSAVVELEGAALLLESVQLLWRGLAEVALGPDDAGKRAERAERLREAAGRLRLEAFPRAIGLQEPGEA